MRGSPIAVLLAAALVLAGVPAVAGVAVADAPGREIGSAPTAAAGPAGGPAVTAANASGSADPGTIDRTFGLSRLPDEPGVVRVQVRHEIPESVRTLSTTVPENATVVETQGFERRSDREYEWTEEDSTPSITYRLPVNRTAERGGGYLFVDTGSWAIVTRPRMPVTYSGPGENPEVVNALAVDGTGVAGDDIAYLGAYREHTREAAGQQFRLVVPAAADLAERPGNVFDAVGQAAERDLGPRDESVLVVAAPTAVRWGATGLQRGEAALWVRDSERLDSPDSIWIHEYVHTRQVYDTATETRWTVEGMAEYYAALGTLEQGRIDYDRFRRHLRLGRQYEDAVLADPDTWEGTLAHYHKGTLVMAAIDRRIRLATDRERTLADVLARVNRERGGDEGLTQDEFLDAVEAVAGHEVRAYAREHTETGAAPETWNRSEHMAAFGSADLRYSFDGVEVTGPYRGGTYDAPPTLVPGERLTVRVRVANAGTAPGEYRATLRAGGDAVATRTGTLDAGEATTLRYAVPVEEPGSFDVEVAGLRQTVEVRRPATPRVTDVAAPAEVAPGEQFRVEAAVANPADRPADGEVGISAGGEGVAVRQVQLAPGGTARVGATVAFEEPGEYTVAAGDRETTVRVAENRTPRPTTATATDPPATDPPATDPPATDPPATDPPATDPPATNPPATDTGTGTGASPATDATADSRETRAAGETPTVTPTRTPNATGVPGAGMGIAAALLAVAVATALVTGVLRGGARR